MTDSSTICAGVDCLVLALLTIVPSILWLLFFFFQDKHREKFKNILSVFLWGVAVAFPVVLIETTAQDALFLPLAALAFMPFLYNFVGVAFVEEIAKYLVVRFKAVGKVFFDEPQDAMLYMIVAALGFATIENVAYTFNSGVAFDFELRMNIALIRSVTSTLLHVASSGALGYFLALSLINEKEKNKFLYTGIILAALLHGIYNHFIIKLDVQIVQDENIGSFFAALMSASLLIVSGIIIIVAFHLLVNKKFKNG